MALIKCKECGKEISTQAEECPHCGAFNKDNPVNVLQGVLSVGLLLVTFWLAVKYWDAIRSMF